MKFKALILSIVIILMSIFIGCNTKDVTADKNVNSKNTSADNSVSQTVDHTLVYNIINLLTVKSPPKPMKVTFYI